MFKIMPVIMKMMIRFFMRILVVVVFLVIKKEEDIKPVHPISKTKNQRNYSCIYYNNKDFF